MEESFAQQRIDSHSSLVTNQRVGHIKEEVARLGQEALSEHNQREKALAYWAAVAVFYSEMVFVFSTKQTKEYFDELEKELQEGFRLMLALQSAPSGQTKGTDVARLVFHAYQANHLINMAANQLGYWTRLTRMNPQGLKELLAHLDTITPLEVKA